MTDVDKKVKKSVLKFADSRFFFEVLFEVFQSQELNNVPLHPTLPPLVLNVQEFEVLTKRNAEGSSINDAKLTLTSFSHKTVGFYESHHF